MAADDPQAVALVAVERLGVAHRPIQLPGVVEEGGVAEVGVGERGRGGSRGRRHPATKTNVRSIVKQTFVQEPGSAAGAVLTYRAPSAPPSLDPGPGHQGSTPWTTSKQFYINGQWVEPSTTDTLAVINPATEQPIESIAMGGADDVDAAVAAAKAAFETFSLTSKDERLALLDSIIGVYGARMEELADIISQEVGAPLWLAQAAQAAGRVGAPRHRTRGARRLRVRDRAGHDAARPRAGRRVSG